MQWDDSENAGFTTGKPWFRISDRYQEINVKKALEKNDSVFYYYKDLICLRHEEELLTEGDYQLLLPEDERIFAHSRSSGLSSFRHGPAFWQGHAAWNAAGCSPALPARG